MAIVFGTTLRPESAPLGQAAGQLAERLGQPLRLVHVAEDPRAPLVLGTVEESLLGPVRAELDAEAKRIASATGATVQAHLAAGAVADALVSLAEWELATVLIVGATTRRTRHPLGEIAERVSRRSPVPVLTVREVEGLSAWLSGDRSSSGRTSAALRPPRGPSRRGCATPGLAMSR
jgi:nucleotide-binding universal stress UspA family protein